MSSEGLTFNYSNDGCIIILFLFQLIILSVRIRILLLLIHSFFFNLVFGCGAALMCTTGIFLTLSYFIFIIHYLFPEHISTLLFFSVFFKFDFGYTDSVIQNYSKKLEYF
jgi:hypothetical protein